jgi:hypothetical protein
MDYFDKELILKHKISYLEERINVYENEGSCLVYYYSFNERGLLEKEGLQRMSTTYGVVYNKSDEVIDWYWTTSTGKEYFSEILKDDSKQFNAELKRMQEINRHQLYSKIDYKTKHTRSFSDHCFSIDADYEIELIRESNELPEELIGTKVKENGDVFTSPNKLKISYKYKFKKSEK